MRPPTSRRGAPVCLALLVLTAACASAPPRSAPRTDVEVPDAWTAAADAGAAPTPGADAWWASFGDPELDRIVRRALERNADLRVAAARLSQAQARARIAGAELLPSVEAGVDAGRRKQNFIGLPIPGQDGGVLGSTSTSLGVDLRTSWEIDLWGRIDATARRALADAQATRAELAGARLSVAGQVAKAWFVAVEARQQLRLAEATVSSFEASARQVRDRFERGLRPSLDLRLALANLASAEALALARRRQLDAAVRQLEVLLGDYPAGDLEPVEALPGMPPTPAAGLPAELVARRPDLVAAERRLAASDEAWAAARAALYPRITLTASGGTASNELTDLVDGDFSVWSMVGGLVAPLFRGGSLRAEVERSDGVVRQRLAEYVGTALRAYAEVESALAAESWLAGRARHLGEAAEQAAAARRLAEQRYRNGLAGYVTVLEAQRRALEADSALLAARRARLDNRVDLHLALGGGLDADAVLAADPAPSPHRPLEESPR